MKIDKNIWDKSLILGLLVTCGAWVASFIVISWWPAFLWPSYIFYLILKPTTQNGQLICDLASFFIGYPIYVAVIFLLFSLYDRIKRLRAL
ncbi:MAG TPA: hypothetical protein VFC63_03585 [Blastocatellia bacterium]|nr:hypothetical protein [Blastocatellia bacterium]